MAQIEADETEPAEITRLIGQALDIDVHGLNKKGWADYYYTGEDCYCHDSNIYNNERKTWLDILNGIEDVEIQLAWQLQAHPRAHHRLFIEGLVEPAAMGLYVYKKAQGKNMFLAGNQGKQAATYTKLMAWLHQVSKYWEVVWTPTMAATAMTIVAYYKADQIPEEEHETFHRTFKMQDYHVDIQTMKILNASPKGFGPAAAEAVKKRFGTAWRAWKAPLSEWLEVPGIGRVTAEKYLREIGRGDV